MNFFFQVDEAIHLSSDEESTSSMRDFIVSDSAILSESSWKSSNEAGPSGLNGKNKKKVSLSWFYFVLCINGI